MSPPPASANPPTSQPDLPRWLLGLLALTAGLTVANIYYCQPLLGAMASAFRVGPGSATAVATATQLGYASGLLLLVPLADSFERRTLIVGTTLLSALMLAAVALCPSVGWLAVAGWATGAVSVTPQLAVTYAAGLVAPARRGRTVGLVMSGLLVGILLSRTLSGAVGAHAGWRAVYGWAAAVMLALSAVLAAVLPEQAPARRVPYGELLGSLGRLAWAEPVLRRHALMGALGFAAFSAFWTTLSFHLARLPGHYGSETAGAFGLVGAAGALAAAGAGRLADHVGARPLNGVALALVVGSFALMASGGSSLLVLALGVVAMDAGVQGSHISNQTRVYALSAPLRNRLNSVYMVTYFLGGALGSAVGAHAWAVYGWPGVCAVGAGFGAAALAVLFLPAGAADAGHAASA